METSEISFCNKIATNLISTTFKESILDRLKKYDISILDKNCFLIKNKTISNISKNIHLLSTKTVGNPYYLFLTKINDINYCFYIDKKISTGHQYPRIISVKYRFDDDLYSDTLLDGELVRYNNTNWLFLINNIHLYKTKKTNNLDIFQKIKKLESIFENEYTKDNNIDICNIQIIKYFAPCDIDTFINEFIPSLPYKCKGIYFTPINKKYANLLYIFNNDNIYKSNVSSKKDTYDDLITNINNVNSSNKEKLESSNSTKIIHLKDIDDNNDEVDDDEETVILKLVKTKQPDIYELHANNKDELVYHSIAYLPTLKSSKMVNNMFRKKETRELYFRCIYSVTFNKWIPDEYIEDCTDCDSIEKVYRITNKLKQ